MLLSEKKSSNTLSIQNALKELFMINFLANAWNADKYSIVNIAMRVDAKAVIMEILIQIMVIVRNEIFDSDIK